MTVKCVGGSLDGKDHEVNDNSYWFKHYTPQNTARVFPSLDKKGLVTLIYEIETYVIYEVADPSFPSWTGHIAVIEGMQLTPEIVRRVYG